MKTRKVLYFGCVLFSVAALLFVLGGWKASASSKADVSISVYADETYEFPFDSGTVPAEMFGVNLTAPIYPIADQGYPSTLYTNHDGGGGIWAYNLDTSGYECPNPSVAVGETFRGNIFRDLCNNDVDPDLNILPDLGVKSFRYPDGMNVDKFDPENGGLPWRFAAGDDDDDDDDDSVPQRFPDRMGFPNHPCYGEACSRQSNGYSLKDRHSFGIGEYLYLCEALGATPVITLPLPYEEEFSPTYCQNAPDFDGAFYDRKCKIFTMDEVKLIVEAYVEYLYGVPDSGSPNDYTNRANIRAENGHPDIFGTVYFEVGNEPFDQYPGRCQDGVCCDDSAGVQNRIQAYADWVAEIADHLYATYEYHINQHGQAPPAEPLVKVGIDLYEAGNSYDPDNPTLYYDQMEHCPLSLLQKVQAHVEDATNYEYLSAYDFPNFFITHFYRPNCGSDVCPMAPGFEFGYHTAFASSDPLEERLSYLADNVIDDVTCQASYACPHGKPIAITEWGVHMHGAAFSDTTTCESCEYGAQASGLGAALSLSDYLFAMLKAQDVSGNPRVFMSHYFNLMNWSTCRECKYDKLNPRDALIRRFTDDAEMTDPDICDNPTAINDDVDPTFIRRPMYYALSIFNNLVANKTMIRVDVNDTPTELLDTETPNCWVSVPDYVPPYDYSVVDAIGVREGPYSEYYWLLILNKSGEELSAEVDYGGATGIKNWISVNAFDGDLAASATFDDLYALHSEDITAELGEEVTYDLTAFPNFGCIRDGKNGFDVTLTPFSLTVVKVKATGLPSAKKQQAQSLFTFSIATLPAFAFLIGLGAYRRRNRR